MESLSIEINNIRNIKTTSITIPFDNGVYAFVGANGCGKSTLMLCLAQLVRLQLNSLSKGDYNDNSYVKFKYNNVISTWINNNGVWERQGNRLKFKGLYEGSLFYGTRFQDSTNIEILIQSNLIHENEICDADDYVKQQLGYILQNDINYYTNLKRIKYRSIAQEKGISNLPYFIESQGYLISQYRMSSGECLLISLLHFIYNSIIRTPIEHEEKVLVLIDELELALHPVAVLRLLELLKDLSMEHSNLIVYLSTHSPEIIKALGPLNLFRINNHRGTISLENNCYPSYLIRDLYSNISPDFLLLVEDDLSLLFVNRILEKEELRTNKLIHCVPVGGWENVLELHDELYRKKVLGINTKIISILDGDVEGLLNKSQKKYPHLFLPIQSIEKYLYSVIKENTNPELRKKINDKFFIVKSLDEIVSEYNKGTLEGCADTNKNFYSKVSKELSIIGTTIQSFIIGLMDDIEKTVDSTKFLENLKNQLT